MNYYMLLLIYMTCHTANGFAIGNFTDLAQNKSLTLNSRLQKIIGGSEADIEDYPFMVSIQKVKTGHVCGGTILTQRWILTAAHCSYNGNKIFNRGESFVIAGKTEVKESVNNAQMIDIFQYVNHPHYVHHTELKCQTCSKFEYDISCAKLTKGLTYGKYIRPVMLAAPLHLRGDLNRVIPKVIILGWGATDQENSPQSIQSLKQVVMHTVSYVVCDEYSEYTIFKSQICTMEALGGKDSCQGDSGGPLLSLGTHVQYGIVSNGIGCANPYEPGVNTRVDVFRDFIDDCVNEGVRGRGCYLHQRSKILYCIILLLYILLYMQNKVL